MTDARAAAWNGIDIAELMDLDQPHAQRFRSRLGEINENGRVYGGQLLGQALMAASRTVPEDRRMTAIQFMFLSGAMVEDPVDYEVTALQEETIQRPQHQRLATRRPRRLPTSIFHSRPRSSRLPIWPGQRPIAGSEPSPEKLPRLSDIVSPRVAEIEAVLAYLLKDHPAIDYRVPFEEDLVSPDPREPRMRF